jgi:hypothetical protein
MSFTEFASHMHEYWMLGALIVGLVMLTDQKTLLRIDKKAIKNFLFGMCFITFIRCLQYLTQPVHTTSIIPLGATAFVWWEDAMNSLPLILFRKLIGVSKWTRPIHWLLTFLFMFEFSTGHLYQGLLPAAILSLYIPFSIKMGEKYGIGTVMICHCLYDFITLVTWNIF